MTVSFVTTPFDATTGGTSPFVKTRSVNVAAGSLLFCYTWQFNATNTCTGVTDDLGGTWVKAFGPIRGDGANLDAVLYGWYKPNSAAGGSPTAGTVSAAWSANAQGGIIIGEIAGLAGGGALDQILSGKLNLNAASDISLGTTGTLAQAAEAAVAVILPSSGPGTTPHSGWTLDVAPETYSYCRSQRIVTSATSALNPGWTTPFSGTVSSGMMSFKDAAGPFIFGGPVPAQTGTAGTAQSALPLAGYWSGGNTPYSYAVTAGALPSGWSLNASTGVVTRGASTAGSYAFTVTATDATPTAAAGNSIAVTINAALTISTQPANISVVAGATASFSYVSAGGTAPVTQQWKRNGSNIATTAGFTTAATTVTGGSANNGDLYSVVITDAAGAIVTSSNATLTVTSGVATALTTSGPASGPSGSASTAITIAANGTMSINHNLSATASDGGAVSFSGTVISGGVASVTATYTPASVGAKTVTFSDANGLTAAVFNYTATAANPRILLTANPADQFRAEGSGALLSSKTGTVWVSNPTTGALVVTKAFTTDASGLAGTLSDAALAVSTAYRINFKFSTGEYGVIERTSEAT